MNTHFGPVQGESACNALSGVFVIGKVSPELHDAGLMSNNSSFHTRVQLLAGVIT
jgi:hypothetical protein